MSDIDGLAEAFESGNLLRPSASVPNIVDLANAIARLAGASGGPTTQNSEVLEAAIGQADHLVFIAADGLGMQAIGDIGVGAFIPRHVVAELRTVFPSSTPVVFTSLATGEWPNKHGVPSWHVYLREIDCVSTIIRFNRRSDEKGLAELGLTSEEAYPLPPAAGSFTRDALFLLPKGIADTAYSTYTAGGAPQLAYEGLHAAIDAIVDWVARAERPTFTHLYTDRVDSLAHEHGTGHEKVKAAVQELDRELGRLAEALPTNSRVVLTADHGLLDAAEDDEHEIAPSDDLVEVLKTEPWGDGRVPQFDVNEGEEARFQAMFKERFGDEFYLITTDDAEQLELYGPGPISTLTRARLGNHIAVSRGRGNIWYRYREPDGDLKMVAHHSGLTPDEMLVPLVVA